MQEIISDPFLSERSVAVFFIGNYAGHSATVGDEGMRETVKEEAKAYGDILQFDIVENEIRNNTLKVLRMLHWLFHESDCGKHAKYIMKVSHDVLLNPRQMENMLALLVHEQLDSPLFVMGGLQWNSKPVRNMNSIFYIPEYIYPEDFFGFTYAAGCAYIMPEITARLIYSVGICVRALYLDDVFLVGYLANALQIRLVHTSSISLIKPEHSQENYDNLFIVPDMSPKELDLLWNTIFQIKESQNDIDYPYGNKPTVNISKTHLQNKY